MLHGTTHVVGSSLLARFCQCWFRLGNYPN